MSKKYFRIFFVWFGQFQYWIRDLFSLGAEFSWWVNAPGGVWCDSKAASTTTIEAIKREPQREVTGRLLSQGAPSSFPRDFSSTFPSLQNRSWTVRPYFQFSGQHDYSLKMLTYMIYTHVISGPSSDQQPYFWPSRENLLPAPTILRGANETWEIAPENSRNIRGSILRELFWGVYRCVYLLPRRVQRVHSIRPKQTVLKDKKYCGKLFLSSQNWVFRPNTLLYI